MSDIETTFKRRFRQYPFQVFGINVGESHSIAQHFADNFGLSFPVLLDPNIDVYNQYRVQGSTPFPVDCIIDQNGYIRYLHSEYEPSLMIDLIKDLLGIIDPEDPDPPKKPEVSPNILLKVFPNPSNSEFTFKIESTPQIEEPQLLKLDIYNIVGQNVFSFSKISNTESFTFDLSHLPSNNYFVSIIWGNKHFHKKLILLK